MINKDMYVLGTEPNKIREMFQYGIDRKAEIGEDKVFDLSIGNPSVPAPVEVAECLHGLLDRDPVALHSYTPSAGALSVRQVVAESIAEHWGIEASASNIYLTAGAAASVCISLKAVCEPGDEVITVSPYFPEYGVWARNAQSTLIEVPAREDDFQPDIAAMEAAITPKTSAVIICTPNNPVGIVYSEEVLRELARMLERKEREYGRHIYLISDEPYRLITYGVEVPCIPRIYARTIVCYSFSKSLSLPGERIGYIYVSDLMDNAAETSLAIAGAGRSLGYVCAGALFQYTMAACIDLPCNTAAYAENRRLLMEGLRDLGYTFIEPQGAFYLWLKALEPDAQAFCDQAKKHELLIVPSDCFGCKGWVRVSFCVSKDVIRGALGAFAELKKDYE